MGFYGRLSAREQEQLRLGCKLSVFGVRRPVLRASESTSKPFNPQLSLPVPDMVAVICCLFLALHLASEVVKKPKSGGE